MLAHKHLRLSLPCLLLGLGLTGASSVVAGPPPVQVTEHGQELILDNGVVMLTFTREGGCGAALVYQQGNRKTTLAAGRSILYFDAGGGKAYPVAGAEGHIVHQDEEVAEVAWSGRPSDRFPFDAEMHCRMQRGDPGFYLWAVYQHGAGMAAGDIGETRFVLKGVPGTEVFTHHVVDDQRQGPYPTGKTVETIQDATWRLDDGTIYTKYNNSAYLADHHVHGLAGHGVGLWMIFPSNEFIGGGPFKQELTVHKENVLLSMFVGGHFGSGGLHFRQDEPWSKVYGPVFVYVNEGSTVADLWADAKKRAEAEEAKWPYTWLRHADYPLERGTVRGSVTLTDGISAEGAWVLLSPPDEDPTQVSKGYDFWTRVDSHGHFTLGKVRPGTYTLTLMGANQFEEFRREKVTVTAGTTDLGELRWQPIEHGKRLWQIGVADRSSHEFKGGDDYRHYDNFARYLREFPEDVTFTIGKSREAEDWNFAQWAIYSKKPFWSILFDLPEAVPGKATLTIGFTSANPPRGGRTNLQVKVNGREAEVIHLPKTGPAGYRSGSSDSPYHVVYVTFDGALLRKGSNEITLGHAEAQPGATWKGGVPGEVMYDALRLEIAPAASSREEH